MSITQNKVQAITRGITGFVSRPDVYPINAITFSTNSMVIHFAVQLVGYVASEWERSINGGAWVPADFGSGSGVDITPIWIGVPHAAGQVLTIRYLGSTAVIVNGQIPIPPFDGLVVTNTL